MGPYFSHLVIRSVCVVPAARLVTLCQEQLILIVIVRFTVEDFGVSIPDYPTVPRKLSVVKCCIQEKDSAWIIQPAMAEALKFGFHTTVT
jgi:hypothetical protein